MAISKNKLLKNVSGKIGNSLVVRQCGGKTVIAAAPTRRKSRSDPATTKRQERFRAASKYAHFALKDPGRNEIYAAACRGNQKPYHIAIRDYFKAPVLSDLRTSEYHGLAGQPLIVRATDNFMVTRVQFALLAPNGSFMETGEALPDINGVDWVYITLVNNRSLKGTLIRVTAEDLAKNKTTLEVVL
ncbi:hypothetical protein [Flavihumibacter solisilvae]|uniref:Uncharacterized protein n=1 Tax=Flavihumibacter solisilvae TaxID=1349421 RepID=A0A0C1IBF3_9BACT|nr:hypothetical protein [Flavihumibacter solisilvae]KIC91320.1 hypothetical protein OI18_22390 [Flavihumibacter solisilvae]